MNHQMAIRKRWSDQYLPDIKSILGRALKVDSNFVVEATPEEDMRHNTDMIVLADCGARISCRVRQCKQWSIKNYKNEFTMRCSTPAGGRTEIEKVLNGWGDYFLYGFAAESGPQLFAYFVGDLAIFRMWHSAYLGSCGMPPGLPERPNVDGSRFRTYRIDELPKEFVIERLSPR